MLKARFLDGVHIGGYARTFIFPDGNAEPVKGAICYG